MAGATALNRSRRLHETMMSIPDPDDLRTAAQNTNDPELAKKLQTIARVAEGLSFQEASREFAVGEKLIEKWWTIVASGGIELLVVSYPSNASQRESRQSAVLSEMALQDVLMELASGASDPVYAKRLRVVSALVGGKTAKAAAKEAGVPVSTASTWLQIYRDKGVDGLRPKQGKSRHRHRGALFTTQEGQKYLAMLRAELGTSDKSYDRRISAMAAFIESGSTRLAADIANTAPGTVLRWFDQFHANGISGLRTRRQNKQ